MIRVLALRAGKAYYSQDVLLLRDYATRAPIAKVGLANAGLISRDLRRDDWSALQTLRAAQILDLFKAATKQFMKDELPVGDTGQSPQEFGTSRTREIFSNRCFSSALFNANRSQLWAPRPDCPRKERSVLTTMPTGR